MGLESGRCMPKGLGAGFLGFEPVPNPTLTCRLRWQFAHRTSHLAISAVNTSTLTPLFMRTETVRPFSPFT
jgi:hypothetical protein